MATDFAGKTALITGAGRGIGRAVALGLGDAGARVVLLARTAAQLEETRALLREQGVPAGRVRVVPADLADEEQRGQRGGERCSRRAASTSWSTTRPPSSRSAPPPAIAAADLRLAFEVNVVAPAALTAAVLPGMLEPAGAASSTSPAGSPPTRPAWSAGTPTPPPRPRSRRTP